MRTAFQKNAPVSALERFSMLLNSAEGRKEIAGVLLMNGALVRFNSDASEFKLQKGYIFLGKERIRAVLLNDQSALTIQNGNVLSARLDDLKKFIRVTAPVAEPVPAPPPEPPPQKVKSSKSDAQLTLFQRIVDDLSQPAFAEYLEQRRDKLLRYASRNDYVAEEALQNATVTVLDLMDRKAKGDDVSFCETSAYFDTWMHSIVRNKAIKVGEVEKKKQALSLIGSDEGDDLPGTISEDNLIADIEPGVLSYHGQDDPLGFFERYERQEDMTLTIEALFAAANSNPRVAMLLRNSIKKAGLGEEFAHRMAPAEYAELAKEAGVPIGTIRSGIHRARRDIQHLAEEMGFNVAAKGKAVSVRNKNVPAATQLVAEPG